MNGKTGIPRGLVVAASMMGGENVLGGEGGARRSLLCHSFVVVFLGDQEMLRSVATQFYNVARSGCPVCGTVNFWSLQSSASCE